MRNVSGWSMNGQKGIYGHREVMNGANLQEWALANGFSKPLEDDDFHCTVCYSRGSRFDTSDIYGKGKFITLHPSDYKSVEPLGTEGAVVLKFVSKELEKTWKDCIDKGASWDYEGFTPHITITYSNAEGVDLSKIKLPDFPIILGDLEFKDLEDDYTADKNSYIVPEPFTIDEQTGIKRPKHIIPKEKPVGVLPHFRNSNKDTIEVTLRPEDWFLTQATIMACLPISNDNRIPLPLVDYVNSNFNTYPSKDINLYVDDFKQALLLKNHNNSLAYGFTLDVKPREVKVGNLTLTYIDILTAVNRNIDRDFADKIENQTIKFLSWGHTSGDYCCSVCNAMNEMCIHTHQMMLRNTPTPAVLDGKPYGIIHKHTGEFHVYDVSYLDVQPAYDGAITHKIMQLEKPLIVSISPKLFLEKAGYAAEDEDFEPKDIISKLLRELKI